MLYSEFHLFTRYQKILDSNKDFGLTLIIFKLQFSITALSLIELSNCYTSGYFQNHHNGTPLLKNTQLSDKHSTTYAIKASSMRRTALVVQLVST